MLLCRITMKVPASSKIFKTLVFVDIESTGLPGREDDEGLTRITEICLIAITRSHFLKLENSEARILKKLILPVNPKKPISKVAAKLTGLTNEMLEDVEPLNERKVNLMKSFIEELQTPICFIAHNGFNFDFPLLKEQLKPFLSIFPNDVYFADSLICFRELSQFDVYETTDAIALNPVVTEIDLVFNDIVAEIEKNRVSDGSDENAVRKSMAEIQRANETTPLKKRRVDDNFPSMSSGFYRESFHLPDIYKRLFDSEIPNTHTSEGDAIALLKCCAMYKGTILNWFETNHASFADIKSLN